MIEYQGYSVMLRLLRYYDDYVLSVTDSNRQSQTVIDSHRQSQTVIDSYYCHALSVVVVVVLVVVVVVV